MLYVFSESWNQWTVFHRKEIKEEPGPKKKTFAANLHSKGDYFVFIYVSISAIDFLRVSSTTYELESFELLFEH